jgi:hypothetical protein
MQKMKLPGKAMAIKSFWSSGSRLVRPGKTGCQDTGQGGIKGSF